MAGRVFGAVECYPDDSAANQPRLRIRLFNVAKEQWPEDLLVPIDTGFSGAVMLPSSSYDFFMIGELPKKLWKDYRTMTGPLQMRVAKAFVQTEQASIETLVETPLVGPRESRAQCEGCVLRYTSTGRTIRKNLGFTG